MFWSKRYRFIILAVIVCCFSKAAAAQSFSMEEPGTSETIPFELVRNLIVVQLKINNQGPYNFALDTGVGYMLITEPSLVDSLNIKSTRTVKIHGLGEGKEFEAHITTPLNINLQGIVSHNVSAAVFTEDHFGLSAYAGRTIHGLLGYEFFSQLAVKINFAENVLVVSAPQNMHYYRRAAKLPISIEDRKPYLTTNVTFANGNTRKSKLVIDLGAGHFISMENLADDKQLQPQYIDANLGIGINGPVNGYLSRIKNVELGKYSVKNVIGAFPDNNKIVPAVPRDGNLGIGLLKKFNVIFDYPNNVIYLKPGTEYHRRDEHDMSGMTYYSIVDYDLVHVVVDKVEPGSAASEAGLKKGDELEMIDRTAVGHMTLQQIDDLFQSRDGRPFFLLISRDKKYVPIRLTLKRRV
ncbi:aspartyl protease family protein [Mucilaginibacter ximonensis]|uniref:Aspartyl protease family protein n=1 Tax=Mucilaginibacter ximonensis TaxID=538021 RepID=A0ABW5YDH5_9SPHI